MHSYSQIFALFDGLGGLEMLVIFVLSLMLFGGKRLPEVAKGLGKSVREFKRAASGVEDEIRRAMDMDASPHRRPPIRRARSTISHTNPGATPTPEALPAAGATAAAAAAASEVSETGEPLDQAEYDHHHEEYDYDEDHRHLETASETEPKVDEIFEAGTDATPEDTNPPDAPDSPDATDSPEKKA